MAESAAETTRRDPNQIMWKDRKHWMWFPWTFTVYSIKNERLYLKKGFFKTIYDETLLYRIVDVRLTRNLWQKIIGTGTIHCDSADPTMRDFDIKNIKNPFDTKEQLSELVEKNRRENHVYMRENMMTGGNGADLDMDPGEMFGQDDDCDGNH